MDDWIMTSKKGGIGRRILWFFAKNFGPSLIAAFVAFFLFRLGIIKFDFPFSWAVEIIIEIAIFAVVSIITFTIRIYQLRDILALLFSIPELSSTARDVMVKYIRNVLSECRTILAQLRRPEGAILDRDRAESVYKDCFEYGGQSYVGTDSNVPSVFFVLYEDYLDAQEKYSKTKGSQRILVVDKEDLNHDYLVNSDEWMDLYEWHIAKGCELLQVDPTTAEEIAKKNHLWTTDIGLWQNHALLFKVVNSGGGPRIKIAMVFKGEEMYQNVHKYYDSLIKFARSIDVQADGIELLPRDPTLFQEREALFQPKLARRWEEFVNCPKRLHTMRRFLKEALAKYSGGRILDAATGNGCDSIELVKQGFDVVSNEIDPHLAQIAYRNSRKELSEVLTLTKWNWKEIGDKYDGPPFDVILVLGNSICLSLNAEEQKSCILQLSKILREGGALVIDERNFPNIIKNKKEFLKKGGFQYKREVVYCGTVVEGYPIVIPDEGEKIDLKSKPKKGIVVFEYAHKIFGPVGTLEMYPFQKNELKHMLEDAGFKVIRTYWDLESNPKEYKKKYGNVPPDFFTYVAVKSES